ncbi:MAG: hypothetical protein V1885_03380 [Candidatus Brennerbacteria bacterium]
MFVSDGSDLQNCLGCVNLRHKSNYFFNKPVSKEELEKKLGEIKGSYSKTTNFQKKFDDFSLQFPKKENNNIKAVDCVGDYIFSSKNARTCFEVTDCENCKFGYFIKGSKDSYDLTGFGYGAELLLECVGVGVSQRVIGTYWAEESHDIDYCYCVMSSENCFGCDGLKHAQFSVLNKKYSKEEFEKVRQHIIEEMKEKGTYGHFIPVQLAPFAYNETIAQDNLPLTKEEAIRQGFRWEENPQMTKGKETLKPGDIPDHIRDIPDSITEEILACISCGRNYKITAQELGLYRRETTPIPRKCFYCRHKERIEKRGPFALYARKCVHCGKAIQTTYGSERPEIVYCEQCYQAEVI